MATGGLALLISPVVQPYTFPGLDTIGKAIYIFDIVLFLTITSLLAYRFTAHRHKNLFMHSITHPTESLFVATFLLAQAAIIAGMARYGIPSCGPWLVVVYRVLFWLYFSVSFLFAVAMYTLLFTSPSLTIRDMTPAWDFPIFPFMLAGTIASAGAQYQPPSQAVPMIIGGVMAQGLGFLVSMMMYGIYIRRMIQFGFPAPNIRPAMFIAVGPPSFTALALLGLANDWPRGYIDYFGFAMQGTDTSADTMISVMRLLATLTACFIYSLAAWFFFVTVIANILGAREMTFHLNWWAFVFPNVGFTMATISIGKIFQSTGTMWVGSVLTVLLVGLYLFVLCRSMLAVWRREILWQGKDEDKYYTSLHLENRKMRTRENKHLADVVAVAAGDTEKQD